MQDKRVYLSQEMSAEQVAAQINNWDAVYSGTTLRSALRRLLPRAMLGNYSGSINSDENVRGCLNELEDTATSSRSSFADLWDSTNVEIRDQGSHEKGDLNETTNLLLTCKRQVIYPYFYMLSLVSWRPFHIQSYHYQGCSVRKILNILYTLFIFLLIIFSYASSIIACQARLEVKPESTFAPPVTIQPITIQPITHRNLSTTPRTNQTNVTTSVKPTHAMEQYKIINSNNSQYSTASSNSSDWIKLSSTTIPSTSGQKTRTQKFITFVPIRTAGPVWKPAVTECTHIVSTYVVPNVLHFMAFLIGFYMFRIQENEGLHALIEKVFLLSSVPKKIVSRLRFFLFGGIVMAILGVGNFILFCFAFSLVSVTGFKYNTSAQWAVAGLMVLGQIVELCVSVVTIVNYCAQCELLIFYLREIGLRMEEKTKDLSIIMKDVLEVKKNLSRVNGLISVIATLVVFNYFELAVIGVLNLAIYLSQVAHKTQLMYRVFSLLISFTMVIVPISIAARLTAAARHFKQKSLQTRVFGYPSASQLDLDSFVLFTHSVDMKAKLLFMPIQGSFLSGVAALLVFVLLLMLQSGVIAGSNMYL